MLSLQVRNRDAGRIGTVCLKYDRVHGRYFDVDSQPGEELCPIRPLWGTPGATGPHQTRSAATVTAVDEHVSVLDTVLPLGGEDLREYNDQGGMA